MGRKSASKGRTTEPSSSGGSRKSVAAIVVGVLALTLIVGGYFVFRNVSETRQAEADLDAARAARAAAVAKFGPHEQTILPPIPYDPAAAARPRQVVLEAYRFAAQHPEILSYVPCFCGCQLMGHTGNHDCFVKERDERGDVVAWEEHGVECAVCLDVATRSRELHDAGSSVADIRAAILKEFGSQASTHTPTPEAPHQ